MRLAPISGMLQRQSRRLWKRFARVAGFSPVAYSRRRATPTGAMRTFIRDDEEAVIFDVGANVGQSIRAFRAAFPRATIHSFEPSPAVFADRLRPRYGGVPGIHLWNLAVGAREGTMILRENSSSPMSSLLAPGRACWGTVVRSTEVPVTTLDAFASHHGIDFIHVLKSDTQGFDLDVLQGSERLLRERRIGMIQVEIAFAELYEGLPSLDRVYRHLADRDFAIAGLYTLRIHEGLLGWMDALFIGRAFYAERYRDGVGTIERLTR